MGDTPALEFLMTYAWAIAVALIALTALFFVKGNGGFAYLLPDRVTISGGFSAIDYNLKEDRLELVLKNNKAENIAITGISVAELGCSFDEEISLMSDQQHTFEIPCSNMNKGTVKSDLLVNYISESGLEHTEKGELIAKVSS